MKVSGAKEAATQHWCTNAADLELNSPHITLLAYQVVPSESGWKETGERGLSMWRCNTFVIILFPWLFLSLNSLFAVFLLELLFCGDGGATQNSEEALQFLNKLLSTQHFLQVSLTSSTNGQRVTFLYPFTLTWSANNQQVISYWC